MMRYKILLNTITLIVILIFISFNVFFYQDLHKQYYCFKLGVLNNALRISLNKISPKHKIHMVKNAIPILNRTKMNFLKYVGYWPEIFNGYNQAAFVENLNNDKKDAVRLLLRSLHFHPNLAETYRALSTYLEQAGWIEGARKCRSYHNSLIKGSGINPEDQKSCLRWALKFCSD